MRSESRLESPYRGRSCKAHLTRLHIAINKGFNFCSLQLGSNQHMRCWSNSEHSPSLYSRASRSMDKPVCLRNNTPPRSRSALLWLRTLYDLSDLKRVIDYLLKYTSQQPLRKRFFTSTSAGSQIAKTALQVTRLAYLDHILACKLEHFLD